MQSFFEQLQAGAAWVAAELWAAALGPLDEGTRFYWPHLLIFFVLAAASVQWYSRRRLSPRKLVAAVFPKRVYRHASAKVDYQLYIGHVLIRPLYLAVRLPVEAFSMAAVSGWLAMSLGERSSDALSTPGYVAMGLLLFTARDLAAFAFHRLAHTAPLLWPFHKLHHSAEVLTPVTLYREHPVHSALRSAATALVIGPIMGVLYYLCCGRIDPLPSLVFVTAFDIFAFAGSHLRHSHHWLSYGPYVGRILMSPAQHQIHHSSDEKHLNKNFGVTFAFWDWIFGSLYVPTERENLRFGLGDEAQPHGTLIRSYGVPFIELGRLITGAKPPPVKERSRARPSGRRPKPPRRKAAARRRASANRRR